MNQTAGKIIIDATRLRMARSCGVTVVVVSHYSIDLGD